LEELAAREGFDACGLYIKIWRENESHSLDKQKELIRQLAVEEWQAKVVHP
jgi:hypothetical protein